MRLLTGFYQCLQKYKKILIEIEYPSKSFDSIIDLVKKIRNKYVNYLNIIICISSFPDHISKSCFSDDISCYKIGPNINEIPDKTFINCHRVSHIIFFSSID